MNATSCHLHVETEHYALQNRVVVSKAWEVCGGKDSGKIVNRYRNQGCNVIGGITSNIIYYMLKYSIITMVTSFIIHFKIVNVPNV